MTDISSGASKEALFCIGSNCGDRIRNVELALVWLGTKLTNFKHSPIYATPDCHGGQREYMNAVCSGMSQLSARELETLCKEYELSQGRDSKARAAGEVPVDVDLVAYDGELLRERDFESEFFLIGYRGLRVKG